MSVDWETVATTLRNLAGSKHLDWRFGQDDSLYWIAERIASTEGLLIADEVGLGKTRIAVAVMHAVAKAGGQVAAVVPPTLMHQWEAEHDRFRTALGGATVQSSKASRERRQLRHFLDLFPGEPDTRYPLITGEPFLLISHMFGMPARIGSSSRAYAWALPFIVRSFVEHGSGNWTGVPGLRRDLWDSRLAKQVPAAQWLSKHLSRTFQNKLSILPNLARDGSTGSSFSQSEGASALDLRHLFHSLIGQLLGRFDLVVIDEAHKSRENLEEAGHPTKRLSCIIEQIIPFSRNHRRLCLTATPVQLGEADWYGTLQRMKISGPELERRIAAVRAFERKREDLRSGPATEADVDALCTAALGFEQALSDIVVRRRWSEQPLILEAREVLKTKGAHPHRAWHQHGIKWASLSIPNRIAALAAEGQALAARGTELGIVERRRGERHAQAMDIDEADYSQLGNPFSNQDPRVQRHEHWRRVRASFQDTTNNLGNDALVEHPRIIAACEWIEQITDVVGSKVLVFGSYNKPLMALANSLNIRHYLRDVAFGVPALPPGLHGRRLAADHPIVPAVLRGMGEVVGLDAGPQLSQRMQNCEREYEAIVRTLSRAVDAALIAENLSHDALRTVVRLAALERLVVAHKESDIEVSALVRDLAQGLAVSSKEDAGEDSSLSGREALLHALAQEGEATNVGRGNIARVLMGGSTPATRHILQALFNTPSVRPRVLVAQSRVASEGLNLHEACRHILFLHLEWNPSVIEQQIGRVDRVGSLWARQFVARGTMEAPRIELATVVLEGTSDEERYSRIVARQRFLGAHLFGEVLHPEIMLGMKPEWAERLRIASPSFSPRRIPIRSVKRR